MRRYPKKYFSKLNTWLSRTSLHGKNIFIESPQSSVWSVIFGWYLDETAVVYFTWNLKDEFHIEWSLGSSLKELHHFFRHNKQALSFCDPKHVARFGAPRVDCKFGHLFFQLPGLILHIKAFTITKLDRKQKSESIDLTLVRSLVGGSLYIAWVEAKCQPCQAVFVLLSPDWNRPMPLCCKTSSMLTTSRVYTLFYGQTIWKVFVIARRQEIQHVFFFILQWRFTMATFLVLQEKRICLAGGSQKIAKTQDQLTRALNAGHTRTWIWIPLECH